MIVETFRSSGLRYDGIMLCGVTLCGQMSESQFAHKIDPKELFLMNCVMLAKP